jgi:Family of unknown function (DUF6152)
VNWRGASAVCVAMGWLVLWAAAGAHHGDADRYNQEVVTVTGTVVDVQMVNPHAHIIFDADDGGKPVRWQAELGAPQQLVKQFGWTPSTLKKGMTITMVGRRIRSGAPYLNLTERANIVIADSGREIYRTANFGEPAPQGPKGTLGNQQ